MANTQGIRAGRAYVELGVSDKLTAGLKKAQRQLEAFGAGLRTTGRQLMTGSAAILGPMSAAVLQFSTAGDAVAKMSARTGVSTEALSELGFAAEQSGSDLASLELGLRRMQRTIVEAADGSQTAADALARLGLSAGSLAHLAPEDQFKAIADRLAGVADPALRASTAMEIFGRSGTQLLPMMAGGAAGIERLQQQARQLGLTVGSQTARDAERLKDTLNILRRVVLSVGMAVGEALAPAAIDLADRMSRAVVVVASWIRQNRQLIVSAAKVAAIVGAAGAAMVGLGAAFSLAGASLGGLVKGAGLAGWGFKAMTAAVAALFSPIGLVVAAVGGLGTALVLTTDTGHQALAWLGRSFAWLREQVGQVMDGIRDALAAGRLDLAARILWLALKAAWEQGLDALHRAWVHGKAYLLGRWEEFTAGVLSAAELLWHDLETGWIRLSSRLAELWTRSAALLRKTHGAAVNVVTKQLIRLFGMLDDRVDVQAAQAMADAEYARDVAEIDRERDRRLAEIDQSRQDRLDQARQVHEGTLAAIADAESQALAALDAQASEQLGRTNDQLAEARRQLAEALAEARKARSAEPDLPTAQQTVRRRVDDLAEDLAGRSQQIARAVAGTFNPFVAGRLGASDPQERTARNTEEIARHMRRIVQREGPVFE